MKRRYLILLLPLFLLLTSGQSPYPARQGKDYAVFIAIENYEHWKKLEYPIDDAEAIAKVLADDYGFDTLILRNSGWQEIKGVLKGLQRKKFDSLDQVLIFFSGHGEYDQDTKQGFFIPAGAVTRDRYQSTYFPYSILKADIDAIPCRHIFLALDACYAGAFGRKLDNFKNGDEDSSSFFRPGVRSVSLEDHIQGFVADNLRFQTRFYAASADKEKSPDQSQFAHQFLEALRSTTRQRPILTFYGLLSYLELAKPRPTHGQFGETEAGLKNFLFVRDLNSFSGSVPILVPEPPGPPSEQVPLGANQGMAQFSFASIPAGTVQMKNPRFDNFIPYHIEPIQIASKEVTNAQYCFFLNRMDGRLQDISRYYGKAQEDRQTGEPALYLDAAGRWKVKDGLEQYPVNYVSWYGAQAFCKWLSNATSKTYRLPTEAEWEYVAKLDFRPLSLHQIAWTASQDLKAPQAVGIKASGKIGLYDLFGNVAEWCQDVYQYDLESRKSGPNRVIKGGHWNSPVTEADPSFRGYEGADWRSAMIGFRVVLVD